MTDTQTVIQSISNSKKKTPVKVILSERADVDFAGCRVFGKGDLKIIYGDWEDIKNVIAENREKISDYLVENNCRNSAIPLMDIKNINARIEPGAIIREGAQIGEGAVIMMGAVINIGASVGKMTMIDMNAVLGGRARVGRNCHIGAGAVLAGVIEPPSAEPVIIEDDVMIGANAVILEGVKVGKGSVVAAGAIVTENIPEGVVAAGMPARTIKAKDQQSKAKTMMAEELRKI